MPSATTNRQSLPAPAAVVSSSKPLRLLVPSASAGRRSGSLAVKSLKRKEERGVPAGVVSSGRPLRLPRAVRISRPRSFEVAFRPTRAQPSKVEERACARGSLRKGRALEERACARASRRKGVRSRQSEPSNSETSDPLSVFRSSVAVGGRIRQSRPVPDTAERGESNHESQRTQNEDLARRNALSK